MASKYQNLDVILNKIKALSIPRGLKLRTERFFTQLKVDGRLRQKVMYNSTYIVPLSGLFTWSLTPLVTLDEWIAIWEALNRMEEKK